MFIIVYILCGLAFIPELFLFSALFRDFSENRPYSCVRG